MYNIRDVPTRHAIGLAQKHTARDTPVSYMNSIVFSMRAY